MGNVVNIEYGKIFRHLRKWGYEPHEFIQDFVSAPETTKSYPIYVDGQHLTYLVLRKKENKISMKLSVRKVA